jgi:hypothetical protein
MTVNYTVKDSTGATLTFSAEDIDAGAPVVLVPRKKIVWGPDGTATDVDTGVNALPIQDGGNSITIDGIVAAVGDEAIDVPLGNSPVAVGARASTATPAAVSADGDVQAVWVDRNGRVQIADGGGSLTIDAASLPLPTGAATSAAQLPNSHDVTIDNAAGAAAVNIQDGGNSITIDAASLPLPTGASTLAEQQTQTTALQLLDDVVVADNAAFTDGTTKLAMVGYIFDEAAGTALTENDAAAARVDAKRAQINVIEDGATRARYATVTAANALKIDGSAVTQPVSGTVTANLAAGTNNIGDVDVLSMPTGASAAQVQGTVAHDAAAANNPVLIAARANLNEPAVVADADVTHLWADLFGRLVVVSGHPNPEPPVSLNATASGNTTVIAAPGASLSLYICKGTVHNRAATNRVVRLEDGAAGTIRWRAEIAAEGGGAPFDFGSRGWKLTANTLLNVNLDAAGDVDVNITEFYIAA